MAGEVDLENPTLKEESGTAFTLRQHLQLASKAAFAAALICAIGLNVVDALFDCGLNADCFYFRTHAYSILRIAISVLLPASVMFGAGLCVYALYHLVVFRWRNDKDPDVWRFVGAGIIFGAICASIVLLLGLNNTFAVAWKARIFAHNLFPFLCVFFIYGGLFGLLHFYFFNKPIKEVSQNVEISRRDSEGEAIPLITHIGMTLSASMLAVFFTVFLGSILYMIEGCFSKDAFFSCIWRSVPPAVTTLVMLGVLAVIIGHVISPLLYILYCPLTRIFWTGGYRYFLLFVLLGGGISYMNSLLFVLVQHGSTSRASPFDAFFMIYIVCGVFTGALHWLFLRRSQKNIGQGQASDVDWI